MPLRLTYAARSDVGLLRDDNEDSGYASPRLIAVADGMGGAAAGEVASSVTVAAFARLDDDEPTGDLLSLLRATLQRVEGQLTALTDAEPGLRGMGTTVTAIIRSGNRLGLLHVGDSRGYLLRDGTLEQITRDHTLVQNLIDAGRLTEEEAQTHPQRNVLTRVLDGTHPVEPDLSVRELRAGDRFLICSDGLSGVVSEETIQETLLQYEQSDRAVDALIALALRGGGPDNITCVVADVTDDEDGEDHDGEDSPLVVGAVGVQRNSRRLKLPDTPAGRAARLTSSSLDAPGSQGRRIRRRVLILTALLTLILGIAVGAAIGWYAWAQKQYYVAATTSSNGEVVAVFQGPAQELFGFQLSKVVETSDVDVLALPEFEQEQLAGTIPARSLDGAREIVDRLTGEAAQCQLANPPSGCPDVP
ncbi:MAG TPA: protein phosphatase 2C domain-containing protein [Actinomycetes bacterium]|nr:protein phosphatase 2C domain-containing protein [Actinomycetes bacterium]